jgi:DnaD/phage-associated family protein
VENLSKNKDPAFLFYSSDFLTGVIDLDMKERGQYITLLCLQHQKGHLPPKTICLCLGLCSVSDIPAVLSKFQIDDKGNYYNLRLDEEIQKRLEFSISRSENGKKGGRPKNHMQNHMDKFSLSTAKAYENHIEDENENINENTNNNYNELIKFYESEMGHFVSPSILTKLIEYEKSMGEEILKLAIAESAEQGKRSWKYAEAILKNWQSKGITTVEQAKNHKENYKRGEKSGKDSGANAENKPIKYGSLIV